MNKKMYGRVSNPSLPQRKTRHSIRLQGYDYSQSGAYFVTICTQNRACLFGDIAGGKMKLNDAGRMAESVWNEIPKYYAGIDIDACQIMPNHIHGIVVIVGAGPCACPDTGQPRNMGQSRNMGQPRNNGQPRGVAPTMSLSDVVHRFKTMTTKRYIDGVIQHGWPRFNGKLWQRNYWEHIIRNGNELNRIRQYIINNPVKWESDQNYPGGAVQAVREPPQSYGEEPWMT